MNTINAHQTIKRTFDRESFEKGHLFEDYIVTLFNERKFRLLEWRSDKTASNGVYPESCTYPDLEFAVLDKRKQRFAVECKWREKFSGRKIKWAYSKQIDNYLDYQRERNIRVFIAIGIGGEPSNPEKLFITPLDHISMYTEVFESHLIRFKRNPKQRFEDSAQLSLFDLPPAE